MLPTLLNQEMFVTVTWGITLITLHQQGRSVWPALPFVGLAQEAQLLSVSLADTLTWRRKEVEAVVAQRGRFSQEPVVLIVILPARPVLGRALQHVSAVRSQVEDGYQDLNVYNAIPLVRPVQEAPPTTASAARFSGISLTQEHVSAVHQATRQPVLIQSKSLPHRAQRS